MKELKRIVIIGTSSSGKTTLARKISSKLKIEHQELDSFFWKQNWQESELEEFRQKVDSFTNKDLWITVGNFSKVRDLVWTRATHIIWLDYPLSVILPQFFKRSLLRSIKREILWGTNRETLWNSILKPNSLLIWILKTFQRNKKQYQELLNSADFKHVTFLKFEHPRDTQDFVDKL